MKLRAEYLRLKWTMTSSLIILIFFIWILPLGVFIRPSDAKKFCDGQRPVCLCAHLLAKQKSSPAKLAAAKHAGVEKEASSAGGGGNYYLAVGKSGISGLLLSKYFQETSSLYSLVVPRSIDHVPKA